MIAPALRREIGRERFDAVIVHGHSPAAMLVAAAAGKAAGIPVFMRGETHLGLARSAAKAVLRRMLMGALYGRLDAMLAIGSANAAFYRAMGVPGSKIFLMPYAVDNARFVSESRIAEGDRAAIRARFGARDGIPIILYAAKFQPRKRPADLIRAGASLSEGGVPFHLVMVGSGELEGELRALGAMLPAGSIHFAGFVNQAELPRVYAACDIFVLPSENEPWGLAVNEAMCAGLPIVASAEIGCVADLVRDGVNGRTFPAGDTKALADALKTLLKDGTARRRMGTASREIISRWSYSECLDGLRTALAHARH
jgi:glycosyltransferase involved in cell wall biosynthesis